MGHLKPCPRRGLWEGWGGSVDQQLPGSWEALGSVPHTRKERESAGGTGLILEAQSVFLSLFSSAIIRTALIHPTLPHQQCGLTMSHRLKP